MGPHDLDGILNNSPETADTLDTENHGLSFLNDEWNGSITNGEPFTLQWNETIEDQEGNLRLFRIWYPKDGVITFEPISNITDNMEQTSCIWTPEGLSRDELYAIWVTRRNSPDPQWAISPPWKPAKPAEGKSKVHWRNSVGIPIVVILSIYLLSLATCLLYRQRVRRRKNRKSDHEETTGAAAAAAAAAVPPHMPDDPDRHPSVSSVATAQTLTEEDELVKKEDGTTWIITNPRPPAPVTPGVAWNRVVWRREGSDDGDQSTLNEYHGSQSGDGSNGWSDVAIGVAR